MTPSGPLSLCSLADVRAWLQAASGQTADDALLLRLISAVSYDFLREIRRPDFYPAQDYTEVREGDGGSRMTMRHWPLNSIASVTISTPLVSPASLAIPPSTDDITPGYWIDMDLDPERRWEIYLDGYVFADLASVTVKYNAGYAVVPLDVEQAMIEWVSYVYKSRMWIGQTSKHMAQGESVQVSDADIPPSVRRVVDRYRRYEPLRTPPEAAMPPAAPQPARTRR